MAESTPAAQRPDIYRYLDFREYLADMVAWRQSRDTGYSLRQFARDAGMAAPNALNRVVRDGAGLSADAASRFAGALKLTPQETHYFEHLAAWAQEKDPDRRAFHDRKLSNARRRQNVKELDVDLYDMISNWVVIAVRELVALDDCPQDSAEIAQLIGRQTTGRQVDSALDLLGRLKLVDKVDGRWRSLDPVLATPDKVMNPAVRKYHIDMNELARQALIELDPEDRIFGGVTAGFSSRRLEELGRLIAEQRKQMLEFLMQDDAEENKDMVMQVNYQAFPLAGGGRRDEA